VFGTVLGIVFGWYVESGNLRSSISKYGEEALVNRYVLQSMTKLIKNVGSFGACLGIESNRASSIASNTVKEESIHLVRLDISMAARSISIEPCWFLLFRMRVW
jgi:hypothetical protein